MINLLYLVIMIFITLLFYYEAFTYNREKHDQAEFVKYNPIEWDDNVFMIVINTIIYTLLIFPVMWVAKAFCMLLPYWVTKMLLSVFSISLSVLVIWGFVKFFNF